MSKQRFYDIVAEELQHHRLRPGLWTRAVAETGGEADRARALYIRLRVAELAQMEQSDIERRAAEEERARAQQREAELRALEEQRRRRQAEEFEAERARIEVARAAGPYDAAIFLAVVIVLVGLIWLLARLFSE